MAGEKTASKRRGRPPKSDEDRRTQSLTFRIRDGLRDRLQASADARGRSLSEEIERRLAFSLSVSRSPFNEYIVRSVGEAIQISEDISGGFWTNNAVVAEMCFNAVKSAASVMLAGHDYRNKDAELSAMAEASGEFIGLNAARKFALSPIENIEKINADGIKSFIEDVSEIDDKKGRLREAFKKADKKGAGGLGNVKAALAIQEKLDAAD